MEKDTSFSALKEQMALMPLDEACRIVVSELRSGINAANNAVALLKWELRPDAVTTLTDEQRQHFLEAAQKGIKDATLLIDELLVDGLLRRLERL